MGSGFVNWGSVVSLLGLEKELVFGEVCVALALFGSCVFGFRCWRMVFMEVMFEGGFWGVLESGSREGYLVGERRLVLEMGWECEAGEIVESGNEIFSLIRRF